MSSPLWCISSRQRTRLDELTLSEHSAFSDSYRDHLFQSGGTELGGYAEEGYVGFARTAAGMYSRASSIISTRSWRYVQRTDRIATGFSRRVASTSIRGSLLRLEKAKPGNRSCGETSS